MRRLTAGFHILNMHQPAFSHDRDPVCDLLDLGQDVAGKDHRLPLSPRSWTNSSTRPRAEGSSADVGSSRIRISTGSANVWASMSFCFIPVEYVRPVDPDQAS